MEFITIPLAVLVVVLVIALLIEKRGERKNSSALQAEITDLQDEARTLVSELEGVASHPDVSGKSVTTFEAGKLIFEEKDIDTSGMSYERLIPIRNVLKSLIRWQLIELKGDMEREIRSAAELREQANQRQAVVV